MPSLWSTRPPSPTTIPIHGYDYDMPKSVGFRPMPVTSISRPLTNAELWKLFYFESHARLCHDCLDPYEVHKCRGRLCQQGHTLAQDVARIVNSSNRAREVYDANVPWGHEPIQVELPKDYLEVKSLLKAMERSLRHKKQRPIVSFDSKLSTSRAQSVSRQRSGEQHKHDSPRRAVSASRTPITPSYTGNDNPRPNQSHTLTSEWPPVLPQIPLTYNYIPPTYTTWRPSTPGPISATRTPYVQPLAAAPLLRTQYPFRQTSRSISSTRATAGTSPPPARSASATRAPATATASPPRPHNCDSRLSTNHSTPPNASSRPSSMYGNHPRSYLKTDRPDSSNGSPSRRPVSCYQEERPASYPPASAHWQRGYSAVPEYATEVREPKRSSRPYSVGNEIWEKRTG